MTVTFFRLDSRGHSHYYSIHDRQGNLFMPHSFTVIWGRNLKSGKEKVYSFEDGTEMQRKLRFLFEKRISEGYRVLYSFSREPRMRHILSELEIAV